MSLVRNSWRCMAILAVLGTGCVSDEAHRYYAKERFEPKAPKDVEVLHWAPERPYDVVADFQARGADDEYMQKKAAEIGADAVIVGTFGGQRAKKDEWAGEDSRARTYSRITGTAIRYKR